MGLTRESPISGIKLSRTSRIARAFLAFFSILPVSLPALAETNAATNYELPAGNLLAAEAVPSAHGLACRQVKTASPEFLAAAQQVTALPQFKAWANIVESTPGVHVALDPSPHVEQVPIGSECFIPVTVLSDEGTHLHRWATFLVGTQSPSIMVANPDGEPITLEQWRPNPPAERTSCDGTWKYTHLDKARGLPANVEVTIAGDQGTYVAHLGKHKSRNSPCRDRPLPVAVKRCTAQELVFQVLGDDVLEGCPTFTAHFRITGPDSAEASLGRSGQVVQAHRER